jgi:tRNA/tmRNA/rRNA uracil-C5-methylase (TrmA/RlmC/RlmD family)
LPEFHNDGDRDAGTRTADSARLMHGENPDSTDPREITHWITAYTELLAFKEQMLADMHQRMTRMSQAGSDEVEELDVTIIQTQQRRYRTRLEFWERREQQLGSATGQKA